MRPDLFGSGRLAAASRQVANEDVLETHAPVAAGVQLKCYHAGGRNWRWVRKVNHLDSV